MTKEETEAYEAEQRYIALKKQQDIRTQFEAEKAAHEATVAREAEERRTELELMMEVLKEPERRAIRIAAYTHVLNSDRHTPNNVQEYVDSVALRLARYAIEGKV